MLLQELFKEENSKLDAAYSVEINEESNSPEYSRPPENLEEIGLIFKIDDDGMISESLMDLIINYRLTNLPVLVEIPTQLIFNGSVDSKYLIQLASNVDFSISLLPPGHEYVKDAISMEEYKTVIVKFVDEILGKPNFDKFVYPILNYFEYLMLEQVLGTEKLSEFRPEEQYVQDNYSSIITKEDSNSFKQIIRDKLYDFYGGQESFNLMAKTMLESVCEKTKEMYRSGVETYIHEQQTKTQE